MLFPERLAPPPLISGVLLLRSTENESFRRISRLERPPPSLYALARQLFAAVIAGQSWEWAVEQAAASPDRAQGDLAAQLLRAGRPFLSAKRGTKRQEAPTGRWHPGSDLAMALACHAVSGDDRTLSIFHFWKDELLDDRLAVIKAAARRYLWALPSFAGVPIELVTAPFSQVLRKRTFRVVRCDEGICASDDQLDEFGMRLTCVWDRYHDAHPHRSWHR